MVNDDKKATQWPLHFITCCTQLLCILLERLAERIYLAAFSLVFLVGMEFDLQIHQPEPTKSVKDHHLMKANNRKMFWENSPSLKELKSCSVKLANDAGLHVATLWSSSNRWLRASISQLFPTIFLVAMGIRRQDHFQEAELISPTSYKFMARGLYFSRFLRFHPLEWDKLNNTLSASHSITTRILWGLSVMVTISHYAFLITRSVQIMLNGNSVGLSIYMAFMTAFFTFPVSFCFHMPLAWRELQTFVNQYLRLFRSYKGHTLTASIWFISSFWFFKIFWLHRPPLLLPSATRTIAYV